MRAKKPTELEGTFTLPAHLEFRCFPVECKFTAVWDDPEPEVGIPEGHWLTNDYELTVKDYAGDDLTLVIGCESAWHKATDDAIFEAIDEYCTLQAQDDEPNIQGDE